MLTFGRSTYKNIIGDILSDVNEPAKLADLSHETIQNWIFYAEQYIAEQTPIQEEYVLRISNGITDYKVQDRPVITGASNATPVIVEQDDHEFAVGDLVSIAGVVGNNAANGRKRVAAASASNYAIQDFVRLTGADISVSPISLTTELPHNLVTGGSVFISGSWLTITTVATVTGVDTFTIPVGVSTEFSGTDNIVAVNTVGSGEYVGGGRSWKQNEIPTHLRDVAVGSRKDSGFTREVASAGGVRNLVQRTVYDWARVFPSVTSPSVSLQLASGLQKYWRFYPTPSADGDITLYGFLRINHELLRDESLESSLHLSSEWDESIVELVKARVFAYLKEMGRSSESRDSASTLLRLQGIANAKPARMIVSYK